MEARAEFKYCHSKGKYIGRKGGTEVQTRYELGSGESQGVALVGCSLSASHFMLQSSEPKV